MDCPPIVDGSLSTGNRSVRRTMGEVSSNRNPLWRPVLAPVRVPFPCGRRTRRHRRKGRARDARITRNERDNRRLLYIVSMARKRKRPTLLESAKEVASILEEHWSSLSAQEAKERRQAFSEYVNRVGGVDGKPQQRARIRGSHPSARRVG